MRAILIFGQEVTEVEHNDTLQDYYRLLRCDLMCLAGRPDSDHVAYVDDEGLFKVKRGDPAVLVDWMNDPLVGNVLIVGAGSHGETLPCTLSVEEIRNRIEFMRVYRA